MRWRGNRKSNNVEGRQGMRLSGLGALDGLPCRRLGPSCKQSPTTA